MENIVPPIITNFAEDGCVQERRKIN